MSSNEHFHGITILTPSDWEKFKEQFEAQHPGFFIGLHSRFPGLTPSEIRLLTLLKLEFNIKMMARTLGISPQSIAKSRYRLRKKLKLGKHQSLNNIHESNWTPTT